MHSHLHSARLAPKKANLMAKMVRGMSVPDAMELLRRTSKKSARLFEQVMRSAIANAEHNFKQDAQRMIVKTVIVNQGSAYRRGIPMARGRVRPIRKFLCHISVTLGMHGDVTKNAEKKEKTVDATRLAAKEGKKQGHSPSQKAKKTVQGTGSQSAKVKESLSEKPAISAESKASSTPSA